MNWEKKLLDRGFEYLESSTKTYGNGKFTGSIFEFDKQKVFCPFIPAEDEHKPNLKYQSVKLTTAEELDEYIKTINDTVN